MSCRCIRQSHCSYTFADTYVCLYGCPSRAREHPNSGNSLLAPAPVGATSVWSLRPHVLLPGIDVGGLSGPRRGPSCGQVAACLRDNIGFWPITTPRIRLYVQQLAFSWAGVKHGCRMAMRGTPLLVLTSCGVARSQVPRLVMCPGNPRAPRPQRSPDFRHTMPLRRQRRAAARAAKG